MAMIPVEQTLVIDDVDAMWAVAVRPTCVQLPAVQHAPSTCDVAGRTLHILPGAVALKCLYLRSMIDIDER